MFRRLRSTFFERTTRDTDADGRAASVPAAAYRRGGHAGTASLDPAVVPRYFGPVPNFAHSPRPARDPDGRVVPGTGLRKFVDPLPLPGQPGRDDLGSHLPVAAPDTISYPGCDYYEIGLQEYAQRLHRDLPATRLRGYRQLNLGTDPAGHNTVAPPERPWHLGPMILARRGRPVRVKFINQLPTGRAGELFLPVDDTIEGAGPARWTDRPRTRRTGPCCTWPGRRPAGPAPATRGSGSPRPERSPRTRPGPA